MKYNNSRRAIIMPIVIAVCLSVGILAGSLLPGRKSALSYANFKSGNGRLDEIVKIIEASYVDSINGKDLEEAAIPAILKKLDPHTVYIPANELKRANEPLQGNFDGIGITFNLLTDTILVISTVPGGPSAKAGLLAGDKIIYVNDSLVAGKGINDDDAMGMLKGPRGTIVKLKVLRKGSGDLLAFEIKRGKIPRYSIDISYMLNDLTGYISIQNFAVTTFDEFMMAIKDLKSQGMKRLIIDLRGNSGGVMESAIRIANQLLKKGQLIVFTQGRTQPRNNAVATGGGEFESGDLVILIDERSASASEILAGAIQDNDRGTIIGRRSFGKGLVQEPVVLSDGSGMRITVARYYTPSGRSIQNPYDEGTDKYYEQFHDRLVNGDSGTPDSTKHKNEQVFRTPAGKILYGGGGISPDIFVAPDTSGISNYFQVVRAALIYRFALRYTETNRETLQKYSDPFEMVAYLDTQSLLEKFVTFAESNGVKKDPAGVKISGEIIHIQIKAYIARNILDNKGFYPVWQQIDSTLKYAINFLDNQAKKNVLSHE